MKTLLFAAMAMLAALIGGGVLAQSAASPMGRYVAWIGPQDLVNSRGQRLTEPFQIIRQDRANLHRFGTGDPQDQGDPWFHIPRMRAALEEAVSRARLPRYQRQMLVNGGVWVEVTVLGVGGQMTGVALRVFR